MQDAQDMNAENSDSFLVGYGRVNITPSEPMKLSGYAQPPGGRFHKEVWDDIFLTCLAVSDQEGNTALIYTIDLTGLRNEISDKLRETVSEVTGISAKNVFFSVTHTHSAPIENAIVDTLKTAAVQAAKEALTDRKEAQMYFGKANTENISFVRHYYDVNGNSVTHHHGDANAELVGHTTEADPEMRILQFKRQGGKDVILANWQCHPHMTGGSRKYVLSADIVGRMRTYMEQDLDCLFAYYQGGAGNIDPISRIRSEEAFAERDYTLWGRAMADVAQRALANMTQIRTGKVKVMREDHICNSNKVGMDKLDIAQQIVDYYKAGHTIVETKLYAESMGLASFYHAGSILARRSTPDTYVLPISAVVMGELAWVLIPGEFYDTTMRYVRENSPYDCNFNVTWNYEGYTYYPSLKAWEYGCYETDTSRSAPGTAEAIADHLLEMLNKLHD